jgi:hypothetical protein
MLFRTLVITLTFWSASYSFAEELSLYDYQVAMADSSLDELKSERGHWQRRVWACQTGGFFKKAGTVAKVAATATYESVVYLANEGLLEGREKPSGGYHEKSRLSWEPKTADLLRNRESYYEETGELWSSLSDSEMTKYCANVFSRFEVVDQIFQGRTAQEESGDSL